MKVPSFERAPTVAVSSSLEAQIVYQPKLRPFVKAVNHVPRYLAILG